MFGRGSAHRHYAQTHNAYKLNPGPRSVGDSWGSHGACQGFEGPGGIRARTSRTRPMNTVSRSWDREGDRAGDPEGDRAGDPEGGRAGDPAGLGGARRLRGNQQPTQSLQRRGSPGCLAPPRAPPRHLRGDLRGAWHLRGVPGTSAAGHLRGRAPPRPGHAQPRNVAHFRPRRRNDGRERSRSRCRASRLRAHVAGGMRSVRSAGPVGHSGWAGPVTTRRSWQ